MVEIFISLQCCSRQSAPEIWLSILWLQRALKVVDDGVIGPKTLAAARAADPQVLKARLLAQRLRFMAGLANWPSFSRGWSRRMADLMEA